MTEEAQYQDLVEQAENRDDPLVKALVDAVTDLRQELEYVKRSRDNLWNRVDSLEEGEADNEDDEEETEVAEFDTLLPIHQKARLGSNHRDVRPSDDRAVTIFEYFTQWSTKAPKGRVIKLGADKLRSLMSAERDEHLAWNQVYRACRHLERLTDGMIRFKEHRGSKLLVLPESSPLTASSSGGT